ncbi:MAG TPA: DUF4232 domain-containing protein [Mycobacteriales bacterium]|nr:DUF4232 domain-containing protein [Mycobacteriales bacterium]
MPGTDQFRYLDDPAGPAALGPEDRARIRALGRRRRRQRQAAVALPVLGLAAAGVVGALALPGGGGPVRLTQIPSATSSTASTPAPTTSAPAPTVPSPSVGTASLPPPSNAPVQSAPTACRSSGLHVSLGPSQGTAGSIVTELHFTNAGTAPCTLFGYPGVSFLSAAGSQVGAPAARDERPAATVTLAPGATASTNMAVAEAGNYPPSFCTPQTATQLRVFPPGETVATTVALPGSGVQICSTQSQGAGGQQTHVTPLTPLGG